MSAKTMSFEDAKKWFFETRCKLVVERLKKNRFNAVYVPSKEAALKMLLEIIPIDATVGVGGSVTLREIGVVDALTKRGNPVGNHWLPNLSGKEILEIRRKHLTSEVFLSSSNAVTMDGKLVNADGAGNRVAAMIFGPKRVIVVAGANKIVNTVEEGIARTQYIAAPMNTKRLGHENLLPDQPGGILTILNRKPAYSEFTVILVGETLGY